MILREPTQFTHPFSRPTIAVLFALCVFACESVEADTGKLIYQQKCASCHGADGQGVDDSYDKPLLGDDSLQDLARLIERTMPEEEPEACVGDEAHAVAEYIYHEFYSLDARQKKGLAARIELTRLTVPQYRNAVADLIGHFTPAPNIDSGRGRRGGRRRGGAASDAAKTIAPGPGLRAEYYQSKGMSKADDLRETRVDHSIRFDFEEASPIEDMAADQFAIVWQGALLAEDTGHYEFRIRTQNGARLYLNNDNVQRRRKLRDDSSVAGQSALIDAWVSSGKMRERTARVFLLGGRRYPLRVEFFKYLEKTASIRLEWKPPHGAWSVLDHNHLHTAPTPRVFVVETPFPADDRSLGYERGSSASQQWQAATTSAAVAAANEVVNRLPLLTGIDDDTSDRAAAFQKFVLRFAEIAFRRPLTEAENQLLRAVPFADAPNADAAVRRAVLLILMSPHFLYSDLTPADQAPSPHAIASRLSFALWDSIPDQALLEAAASGQLSTVGEIESQARRMISDPRARAKIRDFFHQWLEIEERDLAKDKQLFPEFDETVVADLRYSLELFIEQVVWSETSDYRQLLLADHLVLNERLRSLYQPPLHEQSDSIQAIEDADSGPSVEPAAEFESMVFEPQRRAGVLTHPYLLSVFAYHDNTSPIHRGVFLTRNIVGRGLEPPPIAVAFKNDEFAPHLTMREKITQLTRDKACMSCHSVINPLGFALENYDAIGRWRTRDNNKPLDTRSEYTTAEGETLEVQSARDVADFAVASESAQRAFITQLFHHLVKQDPTAYGADVVDQLRVQFTKDDYHIQRLIINVVTRSAAHGRGDLADPDLIRDAITKRGESGD